MPRPLVVTVATLTGLVTAGAASAHVVASPSFLASESSASIALDVPNERSAPMTGFAVTAPEGLEIEHVHPAMGWDGGTDGSVATWTGGSLAAGDDASFGMTLRAAGEPGIAKLEADQRYDDGAIVRWPVSITITPAAESPSENLALAAIVGLMGLLVVVSVVILTWRRRSRRAT